MLPLGQLFRNPFLYCFLKCTVAQIFDKSEMSSFPCLLLVVGNKADGLISKRVFQENKARHIFRKTNIFYPLIRTWQGGGGGTGGKTCNKQKKLRTFIFSSFKHIKTSSAAPHKISRGYNYPKFLIHLTLYKVIIDMDPIQIHYISISRERIVFTSFKSRSTAI